jgi:hypothetical protein
MVLSWGCLAYRDDTRCHLCGAPTRASCPACGNGVCEQHALSAQLATARKTQLEALKRLARRVGGTDACAECAEKEAARGRGPAVTVFRAGNPIEAQMLVEALLEEGFDARALGTQNASLLGAGQHIFAQRIEVPQGQAEAASELLEALTTADANALTPISDEPTGDEPIGDEPIGDEPIGDGPAQEPPITDRDQQITLEPDGRAVLGSKPAPRRKSIALGAGLVFPGAAHAYAQRPLTAACLTATFVGGFVWLSQGAFAAGALTMGSAVLTDLTATLRTLNRPAQSKLDQLIRGLAYGAGASLIGAASLLF